MVISIDIYDIKLKSFISWRTSLGDYQEVMGNNRIKFEPDAIYHVYNHGNANDLIFREDTNYRFFLKRYRKYITAIADTYAYCLMSNHFHFIVRLKRREQLRVLVKEKYPHQDPQSFQNFSDLISNQFKNFLISYAKAFNKMYNRRGSLFLDNLNRNIIESEDYFFQAIRYVHLNPVKHGFTSRPEDWSYSSFNTYLYDQPTFVTKEQVIKWFGGRESFIEYHQNPQSFEKFADLEPDQYP